MDRLREIRLAIRLTTGGLLLTSLAAVAYASQAPSNRLDQFWSICGVTLMITFASFFSGGLVGFLFGIPKSLQKAGANEATPNQGGPAEQQAPHAFYQPNTSLEEISDWLTKILVGVGLTQLTALPDALRTYATFAASGLGDFPNNKVFAVSLLGVWLICGFLVSYMLTRIYLPRVFSSAEMVSLANRVDALEKQRKIDVDALRIVQRQLESKSGDPTIAPDSINNLVRQASANIKAQVFRKARKARRLNWEKNKPLMENTIPIFRALVASDSDDLYDANHGQLGFALKDKTIPEWREAVDELTKAIKIRGSWQDNGKLKYELNRAICRIKIDEANYPGQKSDIPTVNLINDDLTSANNGPDTKAIIDSDETVQTWRKRNI